MRSLYAFIIKPQNQRYNNTTKVDNVELILNTEIQDHKFVSRVGVVLETPINGKTGIKKGDEVIVHHNVFRRFHDVKGQEVNSKSYFEEDKYFVYPEQVFMYKRNNEWRPLEGFCFVQPIQNRKLFSIEPEEELTGILKYIDNGLIKNGFNKNDLIGFTPDSEYEFIINKKRLYRVPTNSICIKYDSKGTETEYNPEWLKSG
jgi:hypothetical protein